MASQLKVGILLSGTDNSQGALGAATKGLNNVKASATAAGQAMSGMAASVAAGSNAAQSSISRISAAMRSAATGFANFGRGASTSLNSASAAANKAEGATKKLGGAVGGLATPLRQLGGAMAAAFAVRNIIKTADEFTILNNKLRVVSRSSEEAAQKFQMLYRVARETHSPLGDTVTLYARMAPAQERLGYSTEKMVGLVRMLNQGFLLSGASQSEASSATIQLTQAMSSGVLRGEELNSILEQAPRLARALADGLGVGVGDLRKLGAAGVLTSQMIADAWVKSMKTIADETALMKPTVAQALQDIGTEFTMLIGAISGVTGAGDTLAESLVKVADKMKNAREAADQHQLALGLLQSTIEVLIGAAGLAGLVLVLGKAWTALVSLTTAVVTSTGAVAGLTAGSMAFAAMLNVTVIGAIAVTLVQLGRLATAAWDAKKALDAARLSEQRALSAEANAQNIRNSGGLNMTAATVGGWGPVTAAEMAQLGGKYSPGATRAQIAIEQQRNTQALLTAGKKKDRNTLAGAVQAADDLGDKADFAKAAGQNVKAYSAEIAKAREEIKKFVAAGKPAEMSTEDWQASVKKATSTLNGFNSALKEKKAGGGGGGSAKDKTAIGQATMEAETLLHQYELLKLQGKDTSGLTARMDGEAARLQAFAAKGKPPKMLARDWDSVLGSIVTAIKKLNDAAGGDGMERAVTGAQSLLQEYELLSARGKDTTDVIAQMVAAASGLDGLADGIKPANMATEEWNKQLKAVIATQEKIRAAASENSPIAKLAAEASEVSDILGYTKALDQDFGALTERLKGLAAQVAKMVPVTRPAGMSMEEYGKRIKAATGILGEFKSAQEAANKLIDDAKKKAKEDKDTPVQTADLGLQQALALKETLAPSIAMLREQRAAVLEDISHLDPLTEDGRQMLDDALSRLKNIEEAGKSAADAMRRQAWETAGFFGKTHIAMQKMLNDERKNANAAATLIADSVRDTADALVDSLFRAKREGKSFGSVMSAAMMDVAESINKAILKMALMKLMQKVVGKPVEGIFDPEKAKGAAAGDAVAAGATQAKGSLETAGTTAAQALTSGAWEAGQILIQAAGSAGAVGTAGDATAQGLADMSGSAWGGIQKDPSWDLGDWSSTAQSAAGTANTLSGGKMGGGAGQWIGAIGAAAQGASAVGGLLGGGAAGGAAAGGSAVGGAATGALAGIGTAIPIIGMVAVAAFGLYKLFKKKKAEAPSPEDIAKATQDMRRQVTLHLVGFDKRNARSMDNFADVLGATTGTRVKIQAS